MPNPTLLTLRTQVRARLNISANDRQFPDEVVNRAISQACNNVASDQPNGWWFNRVEITTNVTVDTPSLPVVATDTTRDVEKIGEYLYGSLDGDFWTPIPRYEHLDGIRATGGAVVARGLPNSWNVVRITRSASHRAQLAITFDPPLPAGASVRFAAVIGPADFVDDTSRAGGLFLPFMGAIIEGACQVLARQRREQGVLTSHRRYITAAAMAQGANAAWLKALRTWFATPHSGPSHADRRWRS